MTKRLDDTYYSVLEKMSALQNTVAALADLAVDSHQTCEAFAKSSCDLESDIIRQLGAAGRLEDQQRRISALQARIHASRDRISALASRVDLVQQRVERWEQADREWQERTRRRLKIIWFVGTAVALVFTALMIAMHHAHGGGKPAAEQKAAMSPNIPPWLGASNADGRSETTEESGRRLLWKAPLTDPEQLRAFGEL
ncbi:hypothetical protein UVI_02004980 [Ustilaginoidea virens]|nr:hypothetical protein UVI_02004980 [Ustilaginoidea virens]